MKQRIETIRDIDPKNKRVLVRVDFNVPLDAKGGIEDDTRILASLPTINYLIQAQAKIILMGHIGRPKNKNDTKYSLKLIAQYVAKKLGKPVTFIDDCIGPNAKKATDAMIPGQIILLENVRFYKEETDNDPTFAKNLAGLAEIYVNDAFGSAHRAHASTAGVAQYLPIKVAGLLMERELQFLGEKTRQPEKPFIVILGGSKVSEKINVIKALLDKACIMLIGGAMAYTFALAQGKKVGKSLVEPDKINLAKEALSLAAQKKVEFLLPIDTRITDHFDFDKKLLGNIKTVEGDIPEGWEGIDIGPKTIELFKSKTKSAKTILWNGPMGVFEIPGGAEGTFAIAKAVAESKSISIIGGGDSIAALKKSGYADTVTFMSTGGGASLEFLEGKPLPGVECLNKIPF